VCLGNICRSPTAEAVCRHLLQEQELQEIIHIDSAGTGSWHIGEAPDSRTQEAAVSRGIDMSGQRARQIRALDFLEFDFVLAMDRQNLAELQKIQPASHDAKLDLFMSYSNRGSGLEVPDPYYGGSNGFNIVFDMVEEASRGLIASVLSTSRPDKTAV
jgi:protein-tyrosine phosphatase